MNESAYVSNQVKREKKKGAKSCNCLQWHDLNRPSSRSYLLRISLPYYPTALLLTLSRGLWGSFEIKTCNKYLSKHKAVWEDPDLTGITARRVNYMRIFKGCLYMGQDHVKKLQKDKTSGEASEGPALPTPSSSTSCLQNLIINFCC